MKICIAVGSLLEHDAIGNDVSHQFFLLTSNHIPTVIYAQETANDRMAQYVTDKTTLYDMIDDPDNILIYHHGGCWGDGQQVLEKARCRIFIKYHNITPPGFFEPYNRFHETYCKHGMDQTLAIAGLKQDTTFLCDSRFNAEDFLMQKIDASRIRIIPPFHKLDDFKTAGIHTDLACSLDDGKVNILFVGRLVPNKGHKHLLGVIAGYAAMYDSNIRLTIVGGIDPGLSGYLEELNHLIRVNRLNGMVDIRGSVSFDELHTYYQFSHVFLLMSCHEGFCLPILEAQFHSLAIVALDAGAVPETLGENQVLFDTPDYQRFAAAIHVLSNNKNYRDYVAREGRKNIHRFSNQRIEDLFLKAVLPSLR
ncbi:glycosyltransferase [Desulfobacula phenolica]|uniref:Glycosyltransferase involved in cell wall bisynthesis n=1 Tax=Desulfobacula phenolica TaxID=90732 RepID=A0A1H2DPA5_9BACT|nr:glycosyltransferase [Desulfobacula phenolica]SDT84679.1 Glycosyltransferase involved in cell wall bisynthesis [Desulfobacula phenolica]